MRPPNRRQVSKTEGDMVEGNVVDDSQVIGLECPGLDYKPLRYNVKDELQDSEGQPDDMLDHGVTTLVSGIRNVYTGIWETCPSRSNVIQSQ